MAKKKKVTAKDLELAPDPVWIIDDSYCGPAPFFLERWQECAKRRFGNKERWRDVACELGYVARIRDPESGETYMEPIGFDYDPALYRASLGIPQDMPLLSQGEVGNPEGYRQLWDWLLEEKEAMDGE